jgi:hypothetical protein
MTLTFGSFDGDPWPGELWKAFQLPFHGHSRLGESPAPSWSTCQQLKFPSSATKALPQGHGSLTFQSPSSPVVLEAALRKPSYVSLPYLTCLPCFPPAMSLPPVNKPPSLRSEVWSETAWQQLDPWPVARLPVLQYFFFLTVLHRFRVSWLLHPQLFNTLEDLLNRQAQSLHPRPSAKAEFLG